MLDLIEELCAPSKSYKVDIKIRKKDVSHWVLNGKLGYQYISVIQLLTIDTEREIAGEKLAIYSG